MDAVRRSWTAAKVFFIADLGSLTRDVKSPSRGPLSKRKKPS
jgi:hypothetical protein